MLVAPPTSCRVFPDRFAQLHHFGTSYKEVRVLDRTFKVLAVADVNALVDTIDPEEFGRDERFPYWAELWPSSIILGEYCLRSCDRVSPPTVLEIGCGLGLAGMCAASAGARVHVTDYEDDALAFARFNFEHNLSADVIGQRVTFEKMDWRTPVIAGKFDIVMGSDVLYERRNFAPILTLVAHALCHGGVAVFTDPHRSTLPDFLALARNEGFLVSVVDNPPSEEVPPRVSRIEIRHAGTS